MPKKKKTTSKTSKRSSQKSSQQKLAKTRWLSLEKSSYLLAVASFLVSLIVFWPRISVETSDPLDPRNPFSIPFMVKNDGYLLRYSVHHSMSIKNIELKNKYTFNGGEMGGFDEDITNLRPNNSSAISIQKTIGVPSDFVESAEIYIDLSYKTPWIPHTFKDSYRFKLARKSNGDYVWQKKFNDK